MKCEMINWYTLIIFIACNMTYADKQFTMTASLNPFRIIFGLLLNTDAVHLVLNGVITFIFKSIGITSAD